MRWSQGDLVTKKKKTLNARRETDVQRRYTPKRPTRPSEAFKKARVSTPSSVMGTSAKD
jgi:hypothetical protein